jgi:hypothetical protein
MTKPRSWDDFQQRPAPTAHPVEDDFAELCAGALGSPVGRRLLEALHGRYINHVLGGIPDDRALLVSHAKRQIVRELEDMTARGLALLKAKAEKTKT